VFAVICSPFLFFFSYYYPFELLRLFGIDVTFGLATLFSCMHASTKINYNSIRSAVIGLTKEGLIERIGRGKYQIRK
jgi:hypothetical protein